jgi:hypothetical protein
MIAPCGIEIKVGQVWSRGRTYWDVMVKRFEEDGTIDCWRVSMGNVMVTMKTVNLKQNEFTNKRGGYKLVKKGSDNVRLAEKLGEHHA